MVTPTRLLQWLMFSMMPGDHSVWNTPFLIVWSRIRLQRFKPASRGPLRVESCRADRGTQYALGWPVTAGVQAETRQQMVDQITLRSQLEINSSQMQTTASQASWKDMPGRKPSSDLKKKCQQGAWRHKRHAWEAGSPYPAPPPHPQENRLP